MTGEAVLVVLDILAPVDIEEKEVMKVTSGKGLPQFITWTKQNECNLKLNLFKKQKTYYAFHFIISL